MPHDEAVAGLVLPTRLIAQRWLSPWRLRTRVANWGFALAATVGMISRRHRGAANRRPPTHASLAASLANTDVLVLDVANLANCRVALRVNEALLTGWQTNQDVIAVTGHDLRPGASA